jgi:hypothetical protein
MIGALEVTVRITDRPEPSRRGYVLIPGFELLELGKDMAAFEEEVVERGLLLRVHVQPGITLYDGNVVTLRFIPDTMPPNQFELVTVE